MFPFSACVIMFMISMRGIPGLPTADLLSHRPVLCRGLAILESVKLENTSHSTDDCDDFPAWSVGFAW